jgi:hypothetical protein
MHQGIDGINKQSTALMAVLVYSLYRYDMYG